MRPRIIGLETEYALLFQPQIGSDTPTPRRIFDALIRSLEASHISTEALYRKEGRFLSNSAFIHYEAHADAFSQGLVEAATPECRTALDVVTYQRAIDEILAEAANDAERRLQSSGFTGKVVIGKNSADAFGQTYGCHENYQVDDPPGALASFLMATGLLITSVVFVLPFVLLTTAVLLVLIGTLLGLFSVMVIFRWLSSIPLAGLLFRPVNSQLVRLGDAIHEYLSGLKDEQLAKATGLILKFGLYPAITFYSAYLSRLVLRRYRRYLTGHLVSRVIFSGSGEVSFTGSETGYRISQRAPHIRSVMKVYWDDLNKPIYDIKQFVFEPFGPFRKKKRLHILFSESNMAEVSQYLKVATTALVLDALERGVDLGDVVLASPIEALGEISRVGHAARLRTRDGEVSALELQRRYLEGVRRSFEDGQGEGATPEVRRVLELWDTVLRSIDKNPMGLERDVDWVIKKRILDREVLGTTNWSEVARWGRVLEAVRLETGKYLPYELVQPDDPLQKQIHRAIEEASLDPDEYPHFRELYYSVKKADLKYHQLAPQGGYQLALEREGLVTRITRDMAVSRAKVDAPEGTRAKARGEIIRWTWDRREQAQVGWRRVALRGRGKVIRLDDPFQDTLDRAILEEVERDEAAESE